MASLGDLGGTANLILEAFIKHLSDIEDYEIPERRYVAPGSLPVWDGEQLTVNLQTIDQGQPGMPMAGTSTPTAVVFFATFAISIVRSIPVVQDGPIQAMIPSSVDIGEAGTSALSDAAALVTAAVAIHTAYDVVGPGEGFEIGPCVPLGPEGGLAGQRILVSVSLS